MRCVSRLVPILVCLLLVGCRTQEIHVHGEAAILDQATVEKITEGATTKDDLFNLVGRPGSETVTDEAGDARHYHYRCMISLISWRYLFSPKAHVWTTVKSRPVELDVLVDESDTVQEVAYRHPFTHE